MQSLEERMREATSFVNYGEEQSIATAKKARRALINLKREILGEAKQTIKEVKEVLVPSIKSVKEYISQNIKRRKKRQKVNVVQEVEAPAIDPVKEKIQTE